MTAAVTARTDACAIGLSALCLVHCLVPPLLVAMAPAATLWMEQEWLHRALVITALPISGLAIGSSLVQKEGWMFPVIALAGLALLLAGAFVEAWHDHETLLTVLGATTLASAHALRWVRRHRRMAAASTLIGLLFSCAIVVNATAAGTHGAHVHGESTLEMVVDAGTVQATLRGPAANFYGFERAPKSDDEKAAVAATRAALEAPDRLLAWDAEAGCRIESTVVDLPHAADEEHDDHHEHDDHGARHDHDDHDHDTQHDHDDHDHHEEAGHDHDHDDAHGEHSEVHAQWTWACFDTVAADQVAFRIHSAFPATEVVSLTLLAADGSVIVRELRGDGERLR